MMSSIASGDSIRVGRHVLQREGPLLHVTLHGDPSLAEMLRFIEHYEKVLFEEGSLLLLMDLRDSNGLSAECRRTLSSFVHHHIRSIAAAMYGASFALQTVVNFVSRAVSLLTKEPSRSRFTSTEAEARAWLSEQQPTLLRATLAKRAG